MAHRVLILAGDGIGPEIIAEAEKVLALLDGGTAPALQISHGLIGGSAVNACGTPLPEQTLELARASHAILFGAIGGPEWDGLERRLRPEQGLLGLRSALKCFANLRPAIVYPELVSASTLKPEVLNGLDILIVRELTGGLYFGEPRGIETDAQGRRTGFNTMRYAETEIEAIARVAFEAAMRRGRRVCSVDKANVLETSELWREVTTATAGRYPDVKLQHMYVDNAAMQLVREPGQFDVIVTENMFGDILSDLASMLTGSIGMLPSASLNADRLGLYEPIHGSAPDIAGRGIANPLAMILSVAMMMRHSLDRPACAERIERAVRSVLKQGLRTADIHTAGTRLVSTSEMGDAVAAAISA